MRSRSIDRTRKIHPGISTVSPTLGTRLSRSIKNPPTVSASLSSSSTSSIGSTSCISTPPSNEKPVSVCTMGCDTKSNSSSISPTSSSSASSSVTIPLSPPYSSTTNAKCIRRR